MGIKPTFKNGSLVLMNPKTGNMVSNSDDEALKDFSDESIDSDEFDSEYASDASGELSYDEDELRPLSEIWDIDEKDSEEADDRESSIKLDSRQEELDELSSSEEDDSESSESELEEEASDDEDDVFNDSEAESETGELSNVLSNLKKAKKKTEKQKKKLVSLNIKENELNVPTNGVKLSITDMMEAVNDPAAQDKSGLLKNLEEVKPLAIPLPKRIQERNERSAAFEISKNEVSKWKDDVERLKRAEVIKFPLVSGEEKLKKVSAFAPSDNPFNELESKVNNVLEVSLLNDTKKEALFEQIETAKLSKENMMKKQNDLRLMRDLLFREERKAKRLKKIKSKSYRRIKKKEMLKNKELLEELEGPNEDDQDQDTARAEARMSLKFKNNSSKWAKDMLKHGMTKDKETRAEMEAMLQQGQKLREKIIGQEDSDEDAELEDFENDQEDEEDVIQKKADVGKTGLMNMAFMQKAEAKIKEKNQEDLEKLKRLEQGLDIEDFRDDATSKAKTVLNKGRRIYTPEATKAGKELQEQNLQTLQEYEDEEGGNLQNKLEEKFTTKEKKSNNKKNKSKDSKANKPADKSQDKDSKDSKQEEEEEEEDDNDAANPWLGVNAAKAVKKSSKVKGVDQTSTKAEKQAHKLAKSKKKNAGKPSMDTELINTEATLNINAKFDESSDDEGDIDGGDVESFQQKDLIKEAFEGDDVVKEFEREKKRTIKEEDDQWVTAEQPGFNSWIGGGMKQRKKQKKNQKMKKVKGVKSADARTDKKLQNVIFNEKVNKKSLKYQSDGVPFPYENKEQYERSLRMPIGQEWTTRATFQKMTMPSVITKSGQVIKPLSKKLK